MLGDVYWEPTNAIASASGYVLVHVLSGAIRAHGCGASMGTYRASQTWVEPPFADDIASKNASTVEPAHALVVLMTSDTASAEFDGE